MPVLNLKRLLGRKHLVTYNVDDDGSGPEFYVIPCDKGYIAALNSTELLVFRRGGAWDDVRQKLSEYPIVREGDGFIAVAVLPKELEEIAYWVKPFDKGWLIRRSNWKPIYRMPPIPKPVEAMAARAIAA